MIFDFWILNFKPAFWLSFFTLIKRLFNSSLLSAIRVVSSVYLRLLKFSHLFKNFPQFVVIHTVKVFNVAKEAKVVFFWNSLAVSMIQRMLAIWSSVSPPFLNPACTSGSSWFMYCWSPAWRTLNITWLACEMRATEGEFEHPLASPFFGIGMKTDLFQSCGHCWVFQICWYIESSTFVKTASPWHHLLGF